jgi:hypothetical protein
MKTIKCLRDLEDYGIIPLTGEADALSYRCLCDLTVTGRKLIIEAYGLSGPQAFAENWNNGYAPNEHVASIMLAYDSWSQIGPIALLRDCHTVGQLENGTLFGMDHTLEFRHCVAHYDQEKDEVIIDQPHQYRLMHRKEPTEWYDFELCVGKLRRLFRHGSGPHEGSRNVHAMSGRVT